MSANKIAKRYAVAVTSLIENKSDLEKLVIDAGGFGEIINQSEYSEYFLHPKIYQSEKKLVLEKMLDQSSYLPAFQNCLRVLFRNKRIQIASEVAINISKIVDERLDLLRVKISVTEQPSQETSTKLEQAFSKKFKKNVILEYDVSPKILGGIIAQIGSVVYDGSIRNKLSQITGNFK
mgnify:FL=1